MKNIRNNFITSDLTDGAKIFSFGDVTRTYEIDKNNKSKCLHKLTPAHLKPNNFQKMNVSLAVGTDTKSVSSCSELLWEQENLIAKQHWIQPILLKL